MSLSSLLSSISHSEVLDARKHAKHLSRRGKPLATRSKRIMEKYPAVGVIMSLPVRSGHVLFTQEKLEGYRSACHLISTLAEASENAALQRELASVTDEEMLVAVEEIFSTDKMAFAEWFRSCSQNYYGYVLGMWEYFMALLKAGKNDQSIGLLIVAGGLIIIAENREGKSRCFPNS
jgi:hypothetical protein